MKKRSLTLMLTATMAGSIMLTSCIGSFNLTNKLLAWNKGLDNSIWVKELVFVAFNITLVYPVAVLADLLVINAIEFWSDDNPLADVGTVKEVETENGVFAIETNADGYTITKQGEEDVVTLTFDKAEKTWSATQGEESYKLIQFKNDDEVVMFLPDGSTMDVELSQAGVMAFRQVATNASFYAAR
jgi:Domain of unknown function (DUF3332).